jgi:Domain of unknown function (DUF4328)
VTEEENRRPPMASRPAEPGWWLGGDGQWHPPESRPPVPFKPEEPGWTQRDDGLWYPPNQSSTGTSNPIARRERVLARPPEPGWWQANDGWWYPPETSPGAWGSAPAEMLPTTTGPTYAAGPPAQTVAASGSTWRSMRGLTTSLVVLFAINAVLTLLELGALVNQRFVYEDFQSNPFTVDPDRIDTADGLVATATGVEVLVRLALVVLFIIWFWRAAKNNQALGRLNPRFRPGWAIGCWFVPLANLVLPVLVAQELWKGSESTRPRGDPAWREEPSSPLVWSWWGLYLAGGVAVGVASVYGPSVIDEADVDFRAANMWTMVSTIAFIGAAVLAIYVVRQLTENQEHCLRAQQQAWAASQPYDQ